MSEQLDAGLIAEQIAESDQLGEPSDAREVGRARRRKEDARLVTGRTMWTDNIQLPGMLYVAFLRSPMAHARITRVDASAARTRPGVVAVYSGRDLAEEQGSLPCAWPVTEDIVIPDHPPMAVSEVRYVGEAVACVVATDRYKAADALEAIEVDYEPLEAVLDMTEALAEGAPRVHDSGNRAYTWKFAGGDIDEAFRDAPVVIERTYVQQRLIPSAMEPRAVVATTDGEAFTLYSATQIPHVLRVMLALTTGIPEHKLRVVAPDVGGGFGSKLQVTAEEVLGLLLTRRLGKPVKWTESRSEGNLTVHHGRDQLQRISLAADRDGRIRGVRVELLADMGAYLMLVTPGVPLLGAFMYNGIYKMDAYDFTCTGVFTTKMPTDAYRGAGRPEATFAIERAVDELAHELGMDPVEVRRRNWITHGEFPYTTICGLTYDSGNYEAATEKALALFGYDKLRAEQADRRERRDPVQLGIGVSTYTEMCGLAPSRVLGSLSYGAGGWEHATVRMLPTGKVEVVTGTSAHGQGHETAWSQIVADALGVPFDDVAVLHGDTAIAHKGMDTYGSRSLVVGGVAVLTACEKVKDRARELAAHMLEASADDIEFDGGSFTVRGTTEGKTIQELALAAFAAHDLPDGFEPRLDADATFDPDNFSFPHGTHLCAVEVDTETGEIAIRSYVAVDDVGSVVNPMIVDGQVHGGIAQGIAQALFEEAVYDPDGNLLTTTMADYLIPSAADLPEFTTDRTETPATSNPLGVKGVGEAGTIASTPAVVNAVVDALRPYGVHDVRMPCTPERIWRVVSEAGPPGPAPGSASAPGSTSGPASGSAPGSESTSGPASGSESTSGSGETASTSAEGAAR
ncbi:xanthine dehydrogenase family protein molybdopterin-binding subunit [Streptosporangium sp. CA-135522]|uniref:xanthine dehydrogenase family protein molybdopterin-binding subunit n=1 Tax=Streptosporangium sp. CA-135522 TaxID=3240072 RepID=UPI003D928B52